jgi:hypothetical protein
MAPGTPEWQSVPFLHVCDPARLHHTVVSTLDQQLQVPIGAHGDLHADRRMMANTAQIDEKKIVALTVTATG